MKGPVLDVQLGAALSCEERAHTVTKANRDVSLFLGPCSKEDVVAIL